MFLLQFHSFRYLCLNAVFLSILAFDALPQLGDNFWFVAPEVTQQHGDRPIVFRFATLTNAATVTIEQPANPNFTIQVLNIPPNSAQTLDLTPWIDMIENKPADQILNYGFHITSSELISAYYEVTPSCNCNPDIFSLKGENALGLSFYTPFQNFLNNASYARSAINIVASEDNTQITIIPAADAVGHQANIPFSIQLNKGQTYCLEALSTAANLHLGGSYIVSDKPIAVTLSDDTVQGTPYGGCADLMGDQIIPEDIIGENYIAIKGYLNGPDKIYILATQNNTEVFVDGISLGIINAGETYTYTLSNQSAYIESSLPSYVLHQSGFGCEVGEAILPPLDCTGSNVVTFTRSTNEFFAINLLVQTGGESDFLWNGTPGIINALDFNLVPGSNGNWMFAQIDAGNLIGQGQAARIENQSNKFHMGLIHGGSSSGCRYGYFSDFASSAYKIEASDQSYCVGDTLMLISNNPVGALNNWTFPNGVNFLGDTLIIPDLTFQDSGSYIISGYQLGFCEVIPDTIQINIFEPLPAAIISSDSPRCLSDSTVIFVSGSSNNAVEWYDSSNNLISNNDTIVHQNLLSGSFTYYAILSDPYCAAQVDSITISVVDAPVINSNGPFNTCIDVFETTSSIQPALMDSIILSSWSEINTGQLFENNSITLLYSFPGDPFQTISIENVVLTAAGCVAIDTITISYHPTPLNSLDWQDLCNGSDIQFYDSLYWNSQQTINDNVSINYEFGDGIVSETSNPVHTYLNSGTYDVQVIASTTFCSDTTLTQIFVGPLPQTEVFISDDCDVIQLSYQSLLNGLSVDSVFWNIPDVIQSNNPSILLTDQNSGSYDGMLNLYTNNQCISTVPFNFIHTSAPSFQDLLLPNVITPNNDGINEYFLINEDFTFCNLYKVQILNRWGEVVYFFDNTSAPFSGRDMKGDRLNEGVYFYVMEVDDKLRQGFIHVISD